VKPPPRLVQPLTEEECFGLLARSSRGRLAFQHEDELLVLPVDYLSAGNELIVNTRPDGVIAAAMDGAPAALQVDDLDPVMHTGWTVLCQVTGAVVTDPDELTRLQDLVALPWVRDGRTQPVRLTVRAVTGRRVRAEPGVVPSGVVPSGGVPSEAISPP
jgi:uncharacterized protein